MNISRKTAVGLQWLLLVALLVGTQMPGAWRHAVESSLHGPQGLSSWAHAITFALMAWLARVPPLAWPWRRVLLLALALALLTEGLQFLAMERHPRWIDVVIDMAGALGGVTLAALRRQSKRPSR
ncbi:VanZ family protein [Rhodoferax sp.]|uniref:VanZ family protein n=1 Tax=Rhodoferax sp. TaxID=50421 RepID=UPI00263749EA|nr:VanZ family protein [Rhodoferax sp.]MDD2923920.1 VanZ family protein [Rhodoferax sp.]